MLPTPITSDRTATAGTATISNAINNSDRGSSVVFYIVRKSWDKPKTQIAAFTKIEMAQNCVKCNPGYAAFDEAGNQVYPALISNDN